MLLETELNLINSLLETQTKTSLRYVKENERRERERKVEGEI